MVTISWNVIPWSMVHMFLKNVRYLPTKTPYLTKCKTRLLLKSATYKCELYSKWDHKIYNAKFQPMPIYHVMKTNNCNASRMFQVFEAYIQGEGNKRKISQTWTTSEDVSVGPSMVICRNQIKKLVRLST